LERRGYLTGSWRGGVRLCEGEASYLTGSWRGGVRLCEGETIAILPAVGEER